MTGQGSRIVWGVALGILAAGALLVITGGGDDGPPSGRGSRTASVKVERVAPRQFIDVIEAIGTARANEAVLVTARVSETVQRVNFEDGMLVKKGTILIELTNAEEIAAVREAEANVKQAQQQFDRIKDLVRRGTVSQSTADENVRELEAARSRLAVAEARAADHIIRAPFSGILGLRSVSPGTLVSPGTQITTLDDISIIKLDFQVPERYISLLAPGQQIVTEAAAFPDRQFTGVAMTVASRVDPITRAATVRAEIANPERLLRPGMLLTVNLIADERRQLAVRETAVVPIGEEKFVFVVGVDNIVERVGIVTGVREGGYVEVLGGLSAGQAVVYSGTLRLRHGIKVQVLSDDTPGDTPGDALAGKRISGQTGGQSGGQAGDNGAESGD